MKFAANGRWTRVAWILGSTTCLTPLAALAREAPSAPAATSLTGENTQLAMQSVTAIDAPGTGGGEALGDIVVTATRSAESIQRVPISIQAIGTQKLAERQVTSFSDYANLLPSVSFSTLGPGRSSLFFRGISVDGGAFATAGTYLDEIPITTADLMPDVHIYDIQRVEALSGPQGTLFGSSSLAGTLRIITNKPDASKFEAGYDLTGNKYGKGNAGHMEEGFINLPVTDRIAVRLMGFYRHDGGYIDNRPASLTYQLGDDDPDTTYIVDNADQVKKDYNPVTEYGGRLAIGIELDDNWSITPAITAQHLKTKGSFNYDPRFGDLVVHDFSPTYNKDDWYQAALTIEGKIGDFDIVSATGYFARKIKTANDYTYYTVTYDNFGPGYESYLQFHDNTTGKLLNPTQSYFGSTKQNKFTQEVRITTPKDWFLHFTVGAFYQRQKSENDGDYYITGLASAFTLSCPTTATINPAALPACPDGSANAKTFPAVKRDAFYLVENDTTYKDYAIFAEGAIDVTDRLMLTGGIRGFKADNLTYGFAGVRGSALSTTRAYDLIAQKAGCTLPLPAERLTCINTNIPYKEKGETHKVNLTWQIDPAHMVYATYSTGFRPGGGNRIAPDNPYKSDELSNYEVGFKTAWGSNLRINGAFYYEEWSGVQYSVVPFGFQGAGITVNAGDARVYGVEMDANWRIGQLTLSGSGAYNDAALVKDFCNLDPVLKVVQLASCSAAQVGSVAAAKGTRLPRQPRLKISGSARYEIPFGDYNAFAQAVGFYQSSSTSNLDTFKNSLLGNTPGFASFDFSAGVKFNNISLELFLQNAFDKRGQLSKNTFCSIEYCADSSRTFPIKPQFFGVKLSQRF